MYVERDVRYDLLYVGFRDALERGEVSETVEASPGTYMDFDADGMLVGIEIVNTKTVLGKPAAGIRLAGELVGVKEAAELARKDRANFLRDVASRSDFPEPVARVASGQLWFSRDVKRYLRTFEAGESHKGGGSQKENTPRLPFTGWESRKDDGYGNYRYKDHERYEDHEVMDTSESAPAEERPFDEKDHETFRSDHDSSGEQESA